MLFYHKDELMSTLIGWCVALGGTTTLDMLGFQAFTGATRKTYLGIHFQRCVLLLWIPLIPVSILSPFVGVHGASIMSEVTEVSHGCSSPPSVSLSWFRFFFLLSFSS